MRSTIPVRASACLSSRAPPSLVVAPPSKSGYYDSDRVMQAVAEAFLEPYDVRRAGDKSWRGGGGAAGERT